MNARWIDSYATGAQMCDRRVRGDCTQWWTGAQSKLELRRPPGRDLGVLSLRGLVGIREQEKKRGVEFLAK